MAARLRQLRRRIRNIQRIRQIAKAMHTIASSQVILRKRELLSARPFPEEMRLILSELASWARANFYIHPFFAGNKGQGYGLLVVNADRGLCGRYVDEVNHAALRFLRDHENTQLVVLGDKAIRFFRHGPWTMRKTYRRVERPTLAHAQEIQGQLLSLYHEVSEIHAIYTEFKGELVQRVRVERLLPIPLQETTPREFFVEPDLPTLIEELGQTWLLGKVHQILLEAKTAEHAARRQAMKAATDNADELLQKLTIQYNKARQQRITLELMDILGGAEAIKEEL
ncbi:MAG: ATP synthase F1 subunit gamma [Candidatus Bipolaricaulota bacterium]|nr:ATP synthase F1 subunit gamma [Candidatus Bipolaricaulota bacterium]MDW8126257.1 ATP synthase F1 subunit gamma [Candidatus Bipolaricaulota bacterium]